MRRRPRRLARAVLATLVFVLVIAALDGGATLYLSRCRATRARALASEREHLAERTRPLLLGEPLRNENAADEYRRALALLLPVPKEAARTIVLAAKTGDDNEASRALALLGERCRSAGEAVREGLRRDRCNWKLDREVAIGFQDALALASCLILEGHRKALARDPAGSARNYVEGLALGLDLETGTVAGTAVALTVVESALHALGRLAVSIEGDRRFLGEIDEQLSQIRGSLPGPTELRLERLLLSGAAVDVAIGRARRSEHRLLLPQWPLAVYQLWGDDRVLRRLDQVMDIADLSERKRLLKEISLLFAKDGVSPELREPAISWVATLSATDEVEQLCAAVLTAIRLEGWHGTGRPYAENANALQIPLARYGLRYERSSDGRGYRIWNKIPDEGGSFLLLERKGSDDL